MDYARARALMVSSQVRVNDVTDRAIQDAMARIPRERFVPASQRDFAYVEREFVYRASDDPGSTRVLLTARDFAKLLAAAEISASELVLDIGCGTGYSTAILADLAEMVIGVEPVEAHRKHAQDLLADLKCDNTAIVDGNMLEGTPNQGPFDVIVIAATIQILPDALISQLKPGGRLAAIWRDSASDKGVIIKRTGSSFSRVPQFDAGAGQVLPGFERTPTFVF